MQTQGKVTPGYFTVLFTWPRLPVTDGDIFWDRVMARHLPTSGTPSASWNTWITAQWWPVVWAVDTHGNEKKTSHPSGESRWGIRARVESLRKQCQLKCNATHKCNFKCLGATLKSNPICQKHFHFNNMQSVYK